MTRSPGFSATSKPVGSGKASGTGFEEARGKASRSTRFALHGVAFSRLLLGFFSPAREVFASFLGDIAPLLACRRVPLAPGWATGVVAARIRALSASSSGKRSPAASPVNSRSLCRLSKM